MLCLFLGTDRSGDGIISGAGDTTSERVAAASAILQSLFSIRQISQEIFLGGLAMIGRGFS